jgi:hypothetical protein
VPLRARAVQTRALLESPIVCTNGGEEEGGVDVLSYNEMYMQIDSLFAAMPLLVCSKQVVLQHD